MAGRWQGYTHWAISGVFPRYRLPNWIVLALGCLLFRHHAGDYQGRPVQDEMSVAGAGDERIFGRYIVVAIHIQDQVVVGDIVQQGVEQACLLYTSPSPRD